MFSPQVSHVDGLTAGGTTSGPGASGHHDPPRYDLFFYFYAFSSHFLSSLFVSVALPRVTQRVPCLSRLRSVPFSNTSEPSHGRGAPEVPEPLTLGAQYVTRYNAWKKIVRAPRPALTCICASPKTNIRVLFSS